MATHSLPQLSSTTQYRRNGRLVAEGHDFETATYWFRIDFGQVREFKSRAQMEAALEAEFAPVVRVPDLPQLPAYIPPVLPRDWPEVRTARRRAWAQLRSRGQTLPTRGVIYLPAPSRALAEVAREDALANFDRWCRLFANLVNGKTLAPREFYFRSAELAKYEQQTALAVSRLAQAWSMAL